MVTDRALRPLLRATRIFLRSPSELETLCQYRTAIHRQLSSLAIINRNTRLHPATKPELSTQSRTFSMSHCLQKKGGKEAREEKQRASKQREESQMGDKQANSKSESKEDPFDFTVLESESKALLEQLKNDLSKLRAGGKFNLESLETLRVRPDKNSKDTVRLTDVATVIPKGRTAQVIVSEQEYVKAVTTAIQSSELSLTPQPDPTGTNPLLLVINIPPPTTERRQAAVAEAAKAAAKAGTSLRDARGKQQKKMRAMQLNRAARPDDLRKAQGVMEKTVEKAQGEIKKIADGAKKALESG